MGWNDHPMKFCQSGSMVSNVLNVILWTCFSERSQVNGKSWLSILKAVHGDWHITKKDEFPAGPKYLLTVTSRCSVTSTVKAGKMTCVCLEYSFQCFYSSKFFLPIYSVLQTDILSVAK